MNRVGGKIPGRKTPLLKKMYNKLASQSETERSDLIERRRMRPNTGKYTDEENRIIGFYFDRISNLLVDIENPTIIITIMLLGGEELTDFNIRSIFEEYNQILNDSSFGKMLEMLYRRNIRTITLDKSDNRFIHSCESEDEVMNCSVIMVDGNIILPAPENLCSWVRENPSAVLANSVLFPKTTAHPSSTLFHVGIIGKEAEYGSWYFTTPHAAFAFAMDYYVRKCGFSSDQLFVQVATSPDLNLFVMDDEYTQKDLFNYFIRETGLSQDKVDEECEGSNYSYAEHLNKLSKTSPTIPKGWIQKRGSSELFGSSILAEEVEYEEVFLTSSARDQVQVIGDYPVGDFSYTFFEKLG